MIDKFWYRSVLKTLIESGGHVERVDQSGWTPLHWASTNGHRDVCLILLDLGASITATTNVSAHLSASWNSTLHFTRNPRSLNFDHSPTALLLALVKSRSAQILIFKQYPNLEHVK